MKILALDTSTEACSAALLIDNNIIQRYQLAPRQQTALILPMIDSLMAEAQVALSQLSALAFTHGPGSFTGVRIAASVVQALAFAADLPVVPISTLQTMAQGAYRLYHAKAVMVCLDARMRQVYWGAYCIDDAALMQAKIEDKLSDPQSLIIPDSNHWTGVGNGWQEYHDDLKQLAKTNTFKVVTDPCYPQSYDTAVLAAAKYTQGNVVTADLALPTYLRAAVV